jgi:hypothetical protein
MCGREAKRLFILCLNTQRSEQLTLIDDWRLVAVVDQSWQVSQVVLIGERLVVDLHETDSELVRLVVNVLELLQGLGALAALGLV